MLLVRDLTAFVALHGPGITVAGEFANDTALSNSGERLRLESAEGATLLDFTYGTAFPWAASADGLGRSLVFVGSDPANPLHWRPSAGSNGNPGATDSFPREPGQGLLDYALADSVPTFDPVGGILSIKRRLGADQSSLTPEWSADCANWSPDSFTLESETVDAFGNSTLSWKLAPLPPDRAFLRVRVTD